jgi:hypothetical protein
VWQYTAWKLPGAVWTPCAQPLELERTSGLSSTPRPWKAAGYSGSSARKPESIGTRSSQVGRTSTCRKCGKVESARYSDVYSGASGHIRVSCTTHRSAPPSWLR